MKSPVVSAAGLAPAARVSAFSRTGLPRSGRAADAARAVTSLRSGVVLCSFFPFSSFACMFFDTLPSLPRTVRRAAGRISSGCRRSCTRCTVAATGAGPASRSDTPGGPPDSSSPSDQIAQHGVQHAGLSLPDLRRIRRLLLPQQPSYNSFHSGALPQFVASVRLSITSPKPLKASSR